MLNRILTIVLVGLYGFVSLGSIFFIYRIYSTMAFVGQEIRTSSASNPTIARLPINETPAALLDAAPVIVSVVLIVILAISLFFFFRTRKLDPKAFR